MRRVVAILVCVVCCGPAFSHGSAVISGFGPFIDGTYDYYPGSADLAYHAWYGGDDGDFGFYFDGGRLYLFSDSTTVFELDDDRIWHDTSTGEVLNLSPGESWEVFLQDVGEQVEGSWPTTPPPVDPYEEAFPDWASAAVKIPLGFAFGLAFWAVCLAFGVPLKWAKEISSAAS